MEADLKERSLYGRIKEDYYNGKYLVIDKDVCKFYHDHLEEYFHIYKPEYCYTKTEVRAMNILSALITLLNEPLIDRRDDPVVHPVQLNLKL
jgi:hypothetical protein